jgi:ribosomal protein L11 methyltransferase
MAWLEFSIEASGDSAEAIEDFLLEQGAQAVTIQDLSNQAIFEPAIGTTPLWALNKVTGLFDSKAFGNDLDAQPLFLNIQNTFKNQAPKSFQLQALEDRDWEREWLKHFQSMCFGERLWIVPSEELLQQNELPTQIKDHHIVLKMDPGLAFGTGTHETTALCLEWLAQSNLSNKIVVDYGCGSGVLGIAAHLLGAKQVLGCDLDPQAIMASEQNALRNNIQSKFDMYTVEEFRQKTTENFKADLVIANILAGPLEKLCPELAKLLDSGGIIALSGILKEQADSLVKVYHEYFKEITIETRNDWVRLVGTKI